MIIQLENIQLLSYDGLSVPRCIIKFAKCTEVSEVVVSLGRLHDTVLWTVGSKVSFSTGTALKDLGHLYNGGYRYLEGSTLIWIPGTSSLIRPNSPTGVRLVYLGILIY